MITDTFNVANTIITSFNNFNFGVEIELPENIHDESAYSFAYKSQDNTFKIDLHFAGLNHNFINQFSFSTNASNSYTNQIYTEAYSSLVNNLFLPNSSISNQSYKSITINYSRNGSNNNIQLTIAINQTIHTIS